MSGRSERESTISSSPSYETLTIFSSAGPFASGEPSSCAPFSSASGATVLLTALVFANSSDAERFARTSEPCLRSNTATFRHTTPSAVPSATVATASIANDETATAFFAFIYFRTSLLRSSFKTSKSTFDESPAALTATTV